MINEQQFYWNITLHDCASGDFSNSFLNKIQWLVLHPFCTCYNHLYFDKWSKILNDFPYSIFKSHILEIACKGNPTSNWKP